MDTVDTLERYFEKTSEFAKAAEPLLAIAVGLKNLDEWKAAREILMTKVAKDGIDALRKGQPVSMLDQGRIQGILSVIDLVEKNFEEGMEKKKAFLLRKAEKNNNLTEAQY